MSRCPQSGRAAGEVGMRLLIAIFCALLAAAAPACAAVTITFYSHRLRLAPSQFIREVPWRREAIAGEPVQKRLGVLADALGRKGEILVG